MSNPHPYPDRVRGELLCQWRTSQQWELRVLAQSANLSVAQLRELESGGSSLFYTPAIKEAAARKVARLLGEDPDAVIAKNGDAPPPVLPSVVDDLVALTCKKPPYTSSLSFLWRHSALLYLPAVLALGFLASQWLHEKWQNGGEQQFWKKNSLQSETPEALVPFAAPSLPVPVTSPATESLPQQGQKMPDQLVVQQAEPQTLADTMPPSSSQGYASSALVSLPASAHRNSDSLCQTSSPDTVLTPSSPRKSGNMVHIVAQKTGVVCVEDADGQRTLVSLKTNEARSVYGAPPWRVHFEMPEQAQLYFQGVRLRMPNPQLMAVALHEGSKKPQ